MRSFEWRGITIERDNQIPPRHMILIGEDDTRREMDVFPRLTSDALSHERASFVAEHGFDVDRARLGAELYAELAAEPMMVAASNSDSPFRFADPDQWQNYAFGSGVFLHGTVTHTGPIPRVSLAHVADLAGLDDYVDNATVVVPEIRISYSRMRGGDDPVQSIKKCRLELFRWLQRHIREEFERHKREGVGLPFATPHSSGATPTGASLEEHLIAPAIDQMREALDRELLATMRARAEAGSTDSD